MSESTMTTDAVVIERTFNAPVAFVWQLWTDAEQFQKWYGPQGAAVPVAKMDVRVGGKRLICMEMRMPDRTMRMTHPCNWCVFILICGSGKYKYRC